MHCLLYGVREKCLAIVKSWRWLPPLPVDVCHPQAVLRARRPRCRPRLRPHIYSIRIVLQSLGIPSRVSGGPQGSALAGRPQPAGGLDSSARGRPWGAVAGTAARSRLPPAPPIHSEACSASPDLSSCFLLDLRQKRFGKLGLRTLIRALSSHSSWHFKYTDNLNRKNIPKMGE